MQLLKILALFTIVVTGFGQEFTTLEDAFGSPEGIDKIIREHDFSKIYEGDGLVVALAPTFPQNMTSEALKKMTDTTLVMVSSVTREIAKIPVESRSWLNIIQAINENPLVTISRGTEIYRPQKLEQAVDKSQVFDKDDNREIIEILAMQAVNWFENVLVKDPYVIGVTKIDFDIFAKILAITGAQVYDLGNSFTLSDSKSAKAFEIGILRYPSLEVPYFKMYRIVLFAGFESELLNQWLFDDQIDKNILKGEFNSIQFEPVEYIIEGLQDNVKDPAVCEGTCMYKDLSEQAGIVCEECKATL